VLNDLGLQYHRSERLDEAIATLKRAVAADPDLAHAYNNLGGMLWQSGDLTAASGAFREAIRMQPGASRSDKVQVCYTVAKNIVVGPGDKELYVQVLDPNGVVLGTNEQVQFDDNVINYSIISKFNYENKNLNICEFIAPNNEFAKGKYTVNVYNQKEIISTSEFSLK
jgi:tetratricopeptide (TPR) repeat protein